MLEVTVEIINSVVEVTIDLPYVGLTVSGIKDDVINGNNHTIIDLPI